MYTVVADSKALYLDAIPDQVLVYIIEFLDYNEQNNLSQVSKKFRVALNPSRISKKILKSIKKINSELEKYNTIYTYRNIIFNNIHFTETEMINFYTGLLFEIFEKEIDIYIKRRHNDHNDEKELLGSLRKLYRLILRSIPRENITENLKKKSKIFYKSLNRIRNFIYSDTRSISIIRLDLIVNSFGYSNLPEEWLKPLKSITDDLRISY